MELNKNKNLKSHQLNDEKLTKIHKEDLGLKIPEDYFSQSKNEILKKVLNIKQPKLILFYNKRVMWAMAASMALFFGLKIYNHYSYSKMNQIPMAVSNTIDQLETGNPSLVLSDTNPELKEDNLNAKNIILKESDVLVKSLFVEDTEIDEYVVNYMLEDI
jgi:hypothetical protein